MNGMLSGPGISLMDRVDVVTSDVRSSLAVRQLTSLGRVALSDDFAKFERKCDVTAGRLCRVNIPERTKARYAAIDDFHTRGGASVAEARTRLHDVRLM